MAMAEMNDIIDGMMELAVNLCDCEMMELSTLRQLVNTVFKYE